jgi:hypothetical protein
MVIGIVIATALLVGFLAGFVCFKKTNEFCGRCGITRQCPVCPEAPAPTPSRIPWPNRSAVAADTRTPRTGGGVRCGERVRAAIS